MGETLSKKHFLSVSLLLKCPKKRKSLSFKLVPLLATAIARLCVPAAKRGPEAGARGEAAGAGVRAASPGHDAAPRVDHADAPRQPQRDPAARAGHAGRARRGRRRRRAQRWVIE